jgi:xanthine dehydrogenase accessory factor
LCDHHYNGPVHLIDLWPDGMKNIHRQLLDMIRSGDRTVLATVIRSSGSTPQQPGISALFGEKGLISGTVGGGILEGEVSQIAQHVIISGISGQYYFNLDSDKEEEGAICGGEAEILVDASPESSRKALEEMERSLSDREGGILVTAVSNHPAQGCSIERYWIQAGKRPGRPPNLNPSTWESIAGQLQGSGGQEFRELEPPSKPGSRHPGVFLEPVNPMPLLFIAGAGHIGRALAHLAALLEFEVTVIDDRAELANRGNIPDADRFIVAPAGPSVEQIVPGPDTYIVIVTRGHLHDAEALKACIGSNAAYIGMIGSGHKVALMKKEFLSLGWATEEQWARVRTPIGIPIGSKSVQEIAVSIAAQLILARNQVGIKDYE